MNFIDLTLLSLVSSHLRRMLTMMFHLAFTFGNPELATGFPDSTVSQYLVLSSGDLLVRRVTSSDSLHTYKCQVKHELSGETLVSKTFGKIIVTG